MKKKLILIALAIASVSGIAYAVSDENCGTVNRLTENLNLDEARANEVERILNSYKQVKEMAKNGQYTEIPAFVETRQTQLAQVLSEEEMQQFKENVGEWAKDMDFSKYKNFAGNSADKGEHGNHH